MATSLRLNGNKDLAAQYWGEGKRVLFQLNQVLEAGGIDTGARHLSYPDGTTISVKSFFGNAIIEVTSPFVFRKEEGKKFRGDVIVFYYKDNVPHIAITDTSILGVSEEGYSHDLNTFTAAELGMPELTIDYPIIAKKFDGYQGTGSPQNRGPVWFIRMPFVFAGPTTEGHYFFEGFTSGAYRDYLYEENTGSFYLIQTGANTNDPFNIGNYIYVLNSGAQKMRAYSFNFDTKAITLEREVSTSVASSIGSVDGLGNFYYRQIEDQTFYGPLYGDFIHQGAGYDRLNVGVLDDHGPAAEWIVIGESYVSYPATLVGHWPGGVVTPFVQGYFGDTPQRETTINLYKIEKVNIWTGVVSTHLPTANSHTPYTYVTQADPPVPGLQLLRTLGYTTHNQCFTTISGESLGCGALTRTYLLDCGEPTYTKTNIPDPPGSTQTREYRWNSSEVIELFGVQYTCPLSFEGDSSETWSGIPYDPPIAYSAYAIAHATQIDLTPTILPFPYGEGMPFHVLGKRTREAVLISAGGLWSASENFTLPLDETTRSFVSPFDTIGLNAGETVAGWMHLQGNGVLTQGVIGGASLGKRIYNLGSNHAELIASYLDVPPSQIQGIIYLPKVDENDPFYQEKVLQNPQ